MFEYGQFKHAQREKNPKLVQLRVVMLGITLGGVIWNLMYLQEFSIHEKHWNVHSQNVGLDWTTTIQLVYGTGPLHRPT